MENMIQIMLVSCCERAYAVSEDDDHDSFVKTNLLKYMNTEYRVLKKSDFDGRMVCKNCLIFKKNGYTIYPSICDRPQSFSAELNPET